MLLRPHAGMPDESTTFKIIEKLVGFGPICTRLWLKLTFNNCSLTLVESIGCIIVDANISDKPLHMKGSGFPPCVYNLVLLYCFYD